MREGWTAIALGSWIAALSTDAAIAQQLCGDDIQESFSFTGALQTSTVPPGAFQVEIRAIGALGGLSVSPDPPGEPLAVAVLGGRGVPIRASFPVTPGEVLTVLVGGQGEDVTEIENHGGGGGGGRAGGAGGGGFNGGGGGGAGGDGGGGSSFVSAAGTATPTDIFPVGPADGAVFLCYSAQVMPAAAIPSLSVTSLAILAVGLVAAAILLLRRAQG